MRQLALAPQHQTLTDWVFEQAEQWGIDPYNDPEYDTTIERLIKATPTAFIDSDTAVHDWLSDKIRKIYKNQGIRRLTKLIKVGDAVHTQSVSRAWSQLTLPGYVEWEASNMLRASQDIAAVRSRAAHFCTLPAGSHKTVNEVLQQIDNEFKKLC